MRAITIESPGGPESLRLTEVPDPVPAAGEVLIAVSAAGLNRADLLQRQGFYPPPPGAPPYPGLGAGQIRPVIDTTLPLAAAAQAHEIMEADRHIGKIMLLT